MSASNQQLEALKKNNENLVITFVRLGPWFY